MKQPLSRQNFPRFQAHQKGLTERGGRGITLGFYEMVLLFLKLFSLTRFERALTWSVPRWNHSNGINVVAWLNEMNTCCRIGKYITSRMKINSRFLSKQNDFLGICMKTNGLPAKVHEIFKEWIGPHLSLPKLSRNYWESKWNPVDSKRLFFKNAINIALIASRLEPLCEQHTFGTCDVVVFLIATLAVCKDSLLWLPQTNWRQVFVAIFPVFLPKNRPIFLVSPSLRPRTTPLYLCLSECQKTLPGKRSKHSVCSIASCERLHSLRKGTANYIRWIKIISEIYLSSVMRFQFSTRTVFF